MTPTKTRLLFEPAVDELTRVELKEAESHANALGFGKQPLPPYALWGTSDPRTLEYSLGLWKRMAMPGGQLQHLAREERQTILAKRGGAEVSWTPSLVLAKAGSILEEATEILHLLDGVSRNPRYRVAVGLEDPDRLGVNDSFVLSGGSLLLDVYAVVSIDRKRALREVELFDVWFGSQCGELPLERLNPTNRERIKAAVYAAHLGQLERSADAPSTAVEATTEAAP